MEERAKYLKVLLRRSIRKRPHQLLTFYSQIGRDFIENFACRNGYVFGRQTEVVTHAQVPNVDGVNPQFRILAASFKLPNLFDSSTQSF